MSKKIKSNRFSLKWTVNFNRLSDFESDSDIEDFESNITSQANIQVRKRKGWLHCSTAKMQAKTRLDTESE